MENDRALRFPTMIGTEASIEMGLDLGEIVADWDGLDDTTNGSLIYILNR